MEWKIILVSAVTAAVVNLVFQVGFYFLIQRRSEKREKIFSGLDSRMHDLEERRMGNLETMTDIAAQRRKEIYEKLEGMKASVVSQADCNRRSESFHANLAELNNVVRRNQVEIKDDIAALARELRLKADMSAAKIAETGAITRLIADRLNVSLGPIQKQRDQD